MPSSSSDKSSPATSGAAAVWVCVLAAVAGAGAIGGCGEPFEPKWRVQEYRILGLKADPVTLEPGEQATLRVLEHRPGDVSVDYDWEWCPLRTAPSDEYECPVDDLQRALDGAGEGESGGGMAGNFDSSVLDLGDGQTARLAYPGTAQQIRRFCEGIQAALAEAGENSPLASLLPAENCERGYDVSVRLVAETDDGDRKVAKKELTLSTGSAQKNANPRLTGLEIRVKSADDVSKAAESLEWVPGPDTPRPRQWVEMPADEPLPVLAKIPYQLRTVVDPDSVETWRPPVPTGSERDQMPPEKEVLVFDWLTTRGDITRGQRIFREDLNDLEAASTSGWLLDERLDGACPAAGGESAASPAPIPRCDVSLWTVVRDGRLGVDWLERQVRLVRGPGTGE